VTKSVAAAIEAVRARRRAAFVARCLVLVIGWFSSC
jgi:hypothetical protein